MSLFRFFQHNDGAGYGMNRSWVSLEAGFRSWQQAAPAWLSRLPTDVSLARFTTFSSVPAFFDLALRLEQIRVASSKFRSALIPQYSMM